MRSRGFTLIELMMTVAVVGILAAIAYPSYISYVVRTHRSAGQQYLLDVAQREEQFLLDAKQYASYTPPGALPAALPSPPPDVAKDYTLTVAVNSTGRPSFQAALKANSGSIMNRSGEGPLFIDSLGQRWMDLTKACTVGACAYDSANAW